MQYLVAGQSSAPPACSVVVNDRGCCNLQLLFHLTSRIAASTAAVCYLNISKQRQAEKADEDWQKGECEHSVQ